MDGRKSAFFAPTGALYRGPFDTKKFTSDFLTKKVEKNRGELPQYFIRNHHPAIISRELFEEAQICTQIRDGRGIGCGGPVKRYPFSKCLICKHCGRFYTTRNRKKEPVWICITNAVNNGMQTCRSEKIYEKQIAQILRKAILDRYHTLEKGITEGALKDDSALFIVQMKNRLETVQKSDFVERDREFMKRKSVKLRTEREKLIRQMEARSAEKEYAEKEYAEKEYAEKEYVEKEYIEKKYAEKEYAEKEYTEKEYADDRMECENSRQREHKNRRQREDENREENMDKGEEGVRKELQKRLHENEKEMEKLHRQRIHMEKYWKDLEENYEWRERALKWMETLLSESGETMDFLDGMTSEYVKALVFSIEIDTPEHCTVHWFDDTCTEVKMYSDPEDYE